MNCCYTPEDSSFCLKPAGLSFDEGIMHFNYLVHTLFLYFQGFTKFSFECKILVASILIYLWQILYQVFIKIRMRFILPTTELYFGQG